MELDQIRLTREKRWREISVRFFGQSTTEKLECVMKTLNNWQPYHNYHHLMAVAIRSFKIFIQETENEEINISPFLDERAKILFLAASLHDIDHSAGRDIDARNILRAVKIANSFIHSFDEKFLGLYSLRLFHRTIKVTQFPFVFIPNSLIEKCIRDADLLMVLEDDFSVFLEGLSREMGKEIQYQQNIDFLKEQTFYTKYGKRLIEHFLRGKETT